jgi:hypothetical protein
VEGGSANDYDYANGDPVNGRDLGGTKKRYVLPTDLDASCLGGTEAQLRSSTCFRYRTALVTGRPELYYHPEWLDRERQNQFERYFNACANGALTSAATGALGGPSGAASSAVIGCAIGVGKNVAKDTTRIPGRTIDGVGDDFNGFTSGASVGAYIATKFLG